MCIMCVIPKGKTLTEEEFDNCWESNPHGGGLITVKNGEFLEVKSLDKNEFKQLALDQINHNLDAKHLIHFRFANVGKKDLSNVHPFKVNSSCYMAHNGTLSGYGISHNSDTSDTNQFSKLIGDLPPNFLQNKSIMSLILEYVGVNNKLVFMTRTHAVVINENQGVYDNGRWFSNNSFKQVRERPQQIVYKQGNHYIQSFPVVHNYKCKLCGSDCTYSNFNATYDICNVCELVVDSIAEQYNTSLYEAVNTFKSVFSYVPKSQPETSKTDYSTWTMGNKPSYIPEDEWREFLRLTDPTGNWIPDKSIHEAVKA